MDKLKVAFLTFLTAISSFFSINHKTSTSNSLTPTVIPTVTTMVTMSPVPPSPTPTKFVTPTKQVNISEIRSLCSDETLKYIKENINGKGINVNVAVVMINTTYSLCLTKHGLPPENMVSGGGSSPQANQSQDPMDTYNDFKNEQRFQCQNEMNKYNTCIQKYNTDLIEYQNCELTKTNPYTYCFKPINFCYKPPSCF